MTQLSLSGCTGIVLPPDSDPDRDTWCTPAWLTALLPHVDLDPCTNPRSTVRARTTKMLERGEDGLAEPWAGSVFCNPPYSDPMPWVIASETPTVTACGFLVNVDPSTSWWKRLQQRRTVALFFYRRIQFTPPPGVEASTNNKPQALLCCPSFWSMCSPELQQHGAVWRKQ